MRQTSLHIMKSGPVVPQVRLMQQYRLSVTWMSDLEG